MPYYKLKQTKQAIRAKAIAQSYSDKNIPVKNKTKRLLQQEIAKCGSNDFDEIDKKTFNNRSEMSSSDVYVYTKNYTTQFISTKSLNFHPEPKSKNSKEQGQRHVVFGRGNKNWDEVINNPNNNSNNPNNNENDDEHKYYLYNDEEIGQIEKSKLIQIINNESSCKEAEQISKDAIVNYLASAPKNNRTVYSAEQYSRISIYKNLPKQSMLLVKVNQQELIVEYKTWDGDKVELDNPIYTVRAEYYANPSSFFEGFIPKQNGYNRCKHSANFQYSDPEEAQRISSTYLAKPDIYDNEDSFFSRYKPTDNVYDESIHCANFKI